MLARSAPVQPGTQSCTHCDLSTDQRRELADIIVFAQFRKRVLRLAILAGAHRLNRDMNTDAEIGPIKTMHLNPLPRTG